MDFAVHMALRKYVFHLPLTRQESMYQREGLMVDPQTLWDPLSALAHHLQPGYEAGRLPGHCHGGRLRRR
ncbi:MAG: transposase [Cystobacter sp.]